MLAANGMGGAGNAVGRAYDTATLPTAPVAVRWMGGAAWVSGAGVNPYMLIDHVDGAIMLAPGSSLAFTVVNTTAVGLASVTWAEVPA